MTGLIANPVRAVRFGPHGRRATTGFRRAWWLALLVMLLAAACGGVARAAGDPAASDWFRTDQGEVRLIAASPAVGDAATLGLGLEFRMAPGWKIYWRSPGDAGLPPSIDWAGSTNLAGATIAWPAPRRFSAYGLETIGYEDAVVLPIAARLATPGQAVALRAAVQYLTCKEICVPYQGVLTLDLPEGNAAGGHADLIARFAKLVPGDMAASGITLTATSLVRGKHPTLDLALAATRPFAAPDAFVEGPAGIAFGAPRVERAGDGRHATLAMRVSGDPAAIAGLTAQSLRLTIVDGDRAFETAATPKPAPPPRDPSLLPAMLGIALLGGLILNVMPCVLPVLSIKLLSVTAHAGRARGAIRRAFLASAAGIIASFLALAAAMLALRGAGLAVGWGMQFQQPAFLVVMVALLALFAGNLAGLFEFALPAALADRLALAGFGRPGLLGDFAAGAVATLLATPCSAPFLGTAVGFALAGSALDVLAIFLALGLGLALPYLAVAAVPGIAACLPRPGRWMLTVRRILAILLGATALWLLSVLAAQTSPPAVLAVVASLVAAALLLRSAGAPALRRGGAALAFAAALAAPAVLPAPAARARDAGGGIWRNFDEAAIASLVRDGKTVFVDVTADWCINCKVNERLILQSAAVARRLSGPEVVAMRADWTRPDAAIGAFLRSFGRYGIPFYAVYGPATPDGQNLPEILTAGEVLGALNKAAPRAASTAAAPRDGG